MEHRRYHIVIASVVFAALLWLSVNMRDEYTVVRQIPVVLENTRDGKALKYPVPKSLSVRFRGNGWLLAGLYLSPGIRYFIDLSTVGSDEFTLTARDLSEHAKIPFMLQPVDVKPDTIVLALEDDREKRVPIVPRFVLDFHEGYGEVGPVRLEPDSVLISGSNRMIATITAWHTTYRKFDDLHAPVNDEIPLEEAGHYALEVHAASTRVTINVQPFAEKRFSGIPLTATGVPPGREVIFVPPRMELTVRGGIDQLERISASDFQATVSYAGLAIDTVREVAPLVTWPEEVRLVGRKPERFSYIIRKKL